MSPRRRVRVVLLGGGWLLILAGVWLAGLYLVEGWIRPWGEPDQSRRFWYLPLLIFGIAGLGGGAGMLLGGRKPK